MDYTKLGMIMQSYATAEPKKYTVYLSDSIYSLVNKEILGLADNFQEACKVITEGLKVHELKSEPYWRFVLDPQVTFVDFGSWSKFAAIVPAIDPKEMERPAE